MNSQHHISAVMYLSIAAFGLIFFTLFARRDTTSQDSLAQEVEKAKELYCGQNEKKVLNCANFNDGRVGMPCFWECVTEEAPTPVPSDVIFEDGMEPNI